jgi:hypothetical protein
MGVLANNRTYSSAHSDDIPSTMEPSFARISVCLRDNLAFFSSLSNKTTMYSICGRVDLEYYLLQHLRKTSYLVTPQQLVALSILQAVPYTKKLCNTKVSNAVCMLLCLLPSKRLSDIQ